MKKYKVRGFKEYYNKIVRLDNFIIEAKNIASAVKKAKKQIGKNYAELMVEEIDE